jgi:hypothetical protein
MRSKVQKTLFCDVTKIENFDKKCFTLSKEGPFKQFCLGRSKFPVKGLSIRDNKKNSQPQNQKMATKSKMAAKPFLN